MKITSEQDYIQALNEYQVLMSLGRPDTREAAFERCAEIRLAIREYMSLTV